MGFIMYGIPIAFLFLAGYVIFDNYKRNKTLVNMLIVVSIIVFIHLFFMLFLKGWFILGTIFFTLMALLVSIIVYVYLLNRTRNRR